MISPNSDLVQFVRSLSQEEKDAFLLANLNEGFDYVPLPVVTVHTAAAEIIPKAENDVPRNFLIYNNGANSIWLQFGNATPISDSTTPTYNGYGIRITGGNYYESPHATVTPVKAVSFGGDTKITVVLIVPRKPRKPIDCRAVCPA